MHKNKMQVNLLKDVNKLLDQLMDPDDCNLDVYVKINKFIEVSMLIKNVKTERRLWKKINVIKVKTR